MPPGFPPNGTYNASIVPRYSFNLSAVQSLLLSAMEHPLTRFDFFNGTSAPTGIFNNTFGCPLLATNGHCLNPVSQTITLSYPSGDSVDGDIMTQIAASINNVSSTYNMGLSVVVTPIPSSVLLTEGFSGNLFMWASNAVADYPWALDFLLPLYNPFNAFPLSTGWNLTAMANLYSQGVAASSTGNISGVVAVSGMMNQIANNAVMYLWTVYPEFSQPMTSNVHGFNYDPAIYGTLQYFATLS
jgi:hypothetical protein